MVDAHIFAATTLSNTDVLVSKDLHYQKMAQVATVNLSSIVGN